MNEPCRFLLNDVLVETQEAGGMALLDFVRRRSLCGTKEGCKEGDCGACTVLVGELVEADGEVCYRPMTSCLMPLAEAAGKHVVTIEGLDLGRPNTVQREMLETGASQCGFCTPGIAVSLTGALMEKAPDCSDRGVRRALSGHLCRCTGYRSLKEAARRAYDRLEGMAGVEALVKAGELPAYFGGVAQRLRDLSANGAAATPSPASTRRLVAGGTDLYVQRGELLPDEEILALNLRPELRFIRRGDGFLRLGALTTFEDLAQDGELNQRLPGLAGWMDLVASWQIRNRSTIGGNLLNASPIGDLTVLLLALDAVCVFEDPGGDTRELPLRALYLGYKQLASRSDEILLEVKVPDLAEGEGADFEKVSKRRWLDIATVNSAARVHWNGEVVEEAGLAVGGVAPVPLFLEAASQVLVGRRPEVSVALEMLTVAQEEISPISDVRGSADYKRLLTRQLLIAHVTKLFPEQLRPEDLYR